MRTYNDWTSNCCELWPQASYEKNSWHFQQNLKPPLHDDWSYFEMKYLIIVALLWAGMVQAAQIPIVIAVQEVLAQAT